MDPYDYKAGSKLMEHSWIKNDFLNSLETLLLSREAIELFKAKGEKISDFPGRWSGNRIVHTGDYMDEGIFLDSKDKETWEKKGDKNRKWEDVNLYIFANKFYKKIKPKLSILPSNRFLVNHTKKSFVDISRYKEGLKRISKDAKKEWIIHPLSLLTASGNNRGGGDYRGCYNDFVLVGSWCGDSISVEFVHPDSGYSICNVCFYER